MSFLIDLHCHTNRYSACSSLTVEMLVDRARGAGIDAVCLTEHDCCWPEDEIRAASDRLAFPLLRGMEITTEVGHVLVLGIERFVSGMNVSSVLRAAVDAAHGLAIRAHPARAGQPPFDPLRHPGLFDAGEGLNGSDGPAQNRAAAQLVERYPLPAVGGSDCHSPREAGTAATRLARDIATERELIEELRRGQHVAVDLRARVAK